MKNKVYFQAKFADIFQIHQIMDLIDENIPIDNVHLILLSDEHFPHIAVDTLGKYDREATSQTQNQIPP